MILLLIPVVPFLLGLVVGVVASWVLLVGAIFAIGRWMDR